MPSEASIDKASVRETQHEDADRLAGYRSWDNVSVDTPIVRPAVVVASHA